MKTLRAIMFCALVSGCATTYGKPIDLNKINEIQEGVTTENQVIENLGAPWDKQILDNGNVILKYGYGKAKPSASSYIPIVGLFTGKTIYKQQTIKVMIDQQGIVKKVIQNETEQPVKLFGISK